MELLEMLKTPESGKLLQELNSFTTENANTFLVPSLNSLEKQTLAWQGLIQILKNESFFSCHFKCLEALKILSRSNQHLDSIINDEILDTFLNHAGLGAGKTISSPRTIESKANMVESQKCLFNLMLNHNGSREMLSKCSMAASILERLNADNLDLFAIYLFDLKIMFVLTAKCEEARQPLRQSERALHILEAFLRKLILKGAQSLNDEEVDLCIEDLRILFNLLLPNVKIQSEIQDYVEEDTKLQSSLVEIIRVVLAVDSNSSARKEELKSQAVNLLLNISPECYEHLIPAESEKENYLGHDMSSIVNLLAFLESRLNQPTRILEEKLVPILSVLIQYSRSQRIVRKFLRSKILPPLRDVTHRPEEGDALRNKLCRLMTSPVTRVEYMVAELLFILCKESVGRLIKYTGYGNAAGLLAHRGLMMGQKSGHTTQYSSDSDSDTEEYKNAEQDINPVTGAVEPKRPNLTEHMSEEQKEYEAVRLVNMIDQLQRQGIIKPAKIGEDGKPQPIEHVLELQKNFNET